MIGPRTSRALRLAIFGAALLASVVVREGPSPAINQSVIWLPTGVAVAGLWLLGLRAWWVVAVCTLLQRQLLHYDVRMSLPAAAGSVLEAALGVLLLQRFGFRSSIARLRDAAALLATAAIAPFGSILCSWVARALIWAPGQAFYSGWDGWWRMNALGVLTVLPVASTWSTVRWRTLRPRRVAGVLAALAAAPVLVFAAMEIVPDSTLGVMVLNMILALSVLYVAVRYGVRGATLAGTVPALVVAVVTTRGYGPFIGVPTAQRHPTLQLFELMLVAIPPAFGALIAERQAALERGRRSDELRRSIQAALPDITYRIHRDGTCLEVSVPAGVEAPFRPVDLIGRSLLDLMPRGQGEHVRTAVLAAFERGEPATVEYDLVVGGQRIVREARCVPSGPDEVLAVVRDITDRKWAEGTMAYETQVLGVVAAGRPAAEVHAAIVAGIERLSLGARCSLVELRGGRMHVALAPSLPAEFNAGLEGVESGPTVGSCGAAASTGRTVVVRDIATDPLWAPYRHFALRHGLRSCWSVPIRDAAGVVLGTIAVYHGEPRDPLPQELALAERAAALAGIALDREHRSEALRLSEELLASINRNVKEGLYRATPDGRVLYANLAFAHLFGYESPEQIVGVLLAGIFDDARRRRDRESQADDGPWLNEEVRLRRVDGTSFWGLLSGTAVRDAGGTILWYDGAIADITARKELEEQFRQSQKMEAVGKLAGGVAHDFNNLLTVIFGYAEAIRAESGEPDHVRAHVDQVLDAARRASGLTRQLLAYSRQQVLSPQVLELTAVVDHMGGMLRRLIGEHIGLTIEHRSGACWVRVDRSQLEQVLLNLVVNARDAMPGGGALVITTVLAEVDDPATRAHPDELPGARVRLSVRDLGSGMSPEVRARAFDPFFTTKNPGKGTGLGLSTVYGIVKQSGGAVWLESAPGAGTTAWISLPCWAEPGEEPAAAMSAPATRRVATVLVVEDEPIVRELVRRTLEREGHRVLEAPDGARALDLSRAHAGEIELVVTDVVMPHMGGRDLAARLADERPGLRFLFISGYPDDVREPRELVGEAGDFLAKPFAPDQLVERVRILLQHSIVRG